MSFCFILYLIKVNKTYNLTQGRTFFIRPNYNNHLGINFTATAIVKNIWHIKFVFDLLLCTTETVVFDFLKVLRNNSVEITSSETCTPYSLKRRVSPFESSQTLYRSSELRSWRVNHRSWSFLQSSESCLELQ